MHQAIIAIIGAVFAYTAPALDVKGYLSLHNDHTPRTRTELERYIQGVGTGFIMANAALEDRRRGLLFCAPGNLALNSDNYMGMIDEAIESFSKTRTKSQVDALLVEGLLLQKLEGTFPCRKK